MLAALGVMLYTLYLKHTATVPTSSPAAGTPAEKSAGSQSPSTLPGAGSTSQPGGATTVPAKDLTYKTFPPSEAMMGSLDQRRTGYRMQVEFTSAGAGVRKLWMSDFFKTVKDKRRFEKDPDTYFQAVKDDPQLQGNYVLMEAVGGFCPLATRAIQFPADAVEPNSVNLAKDVWEAGPVETLKDGDKEIGQRLTFRMQLDRGGKPYLALEKTYTLNKDSYSLLVDIQARNLTGAVEGATATAPASAPAQDLKFSLVQFGAIGMSRDDIQSDKRMFAYGGLSGKDVKVKIASVSEIEKMKKGLADRVPVGRSDTADAVLWAGDANKFFASLLYIVPGQSPPLNNAQAKAEFWKAAIDDGNYLAGVTLHAGGEADMWEIPAGGADKITLNVFAGPKDRKLFDANELYSTLRYIDSMETSSCTFSWLAFAMMWLLDMLSHITFGNYGLAIVLLVVLVRLALHPLTKKSQVSMMRMQKVQPEMAKLKEKYKDDKAKLNQEMMKLTGATPVLGCLPMLLQMPIWVALWTGLQADIDLRQASLFPVWITDLSAPDCLLGPLAHPLATLPIGIGPIVSFNLLPLLLAVAMFIQQKMMPSPQAAMGDPAQVKSQKIMMYFMTVFFLALFYNAPSGLTLYIMASTAAGVVEQQVIRRHIKQKEALESASETRVEMSGRHFRGQKAKKPKGPFRMK
jgi:YidC/Oxa1 family membrane protein insertase